MTLVPCARLEKLSCTNFILRYLQHIYVRLFHISLPCSQLGYLEQRFLMKNLMCVRHVNRWREQEFNDSLHDWLLQCSRDVWLYAVRGNLTIWQSADLAICLPISFSASQSRTANHRAVFAELRRQLPEGDSQFDFTRAAWHFSTSLQHFRPRISLPHYRFRFSDPHSTR